MRALVEMGLAVGIALAIAFASGGVQAARPRFAPMERMNQLHGTWKGVVTGTYNGYTATEPVTLRYESVSDGHAVMERLEFKDAAPMVSMYHQETDQLMMTHYCSANTQPRLRTRTIPRDLSVFKFHFLDSTNILNASGMNIRQLTLEFPSKDKLIQRWESHDAKAGQTVVEVTRVR